MGTLFVSTGHIPTQNLGRLSPLAREAKLSASMPTPVTLLLSSDLPAHQHLYRGGGKYS